MPYLKTAQVETEKSEIAHTVLAEGIQSMKSNFIHQRNIKLLIQKRINHSTRIILVMIAFAQLNPGKA